jgi:hypothetical protein
VIVGGGASAGRNGGDGHVDSGGPVSSSETPANRVIAPELISTSRLSAGVTTISLAGACWCVMAGSLSNCALQEAGGGGGTSYSFEILNRVQDDGLDSELISGAKRPGRNRVLIQRILAAEQ